MGNRQHRGRAIIALVIGGLLMGTVMSAGAVPAVILTNVGQVAQGSLTGIAPVLRLLATDGVQSIGPGPQFDVSLASIRQITLDFPRIVIETDTRTLIGPYSSFRGIAEALQLDRSGEPTVTIATSALRAIALNGHALRPVPRVWLGDGHLSTPEISGAAPFDAAECEDCTITLPRTTPTAADLTPIWNGAAPAYIPPAESSELPWWIGLVGVAVLVVISFLLTSSSSSSS